MLRICRLNLKILNVIFRARIDHWLDAGRGTIYWACTAVVLHFGVYSDKDKRQQPRYRLLLFISSVSVRCG